MKFLKWLLFLVLIVPLGETGAQNSLGFIGSQIPGTSATLGQKQCGTTVATTSSSAVTITVPKTLPQYCNIGILQSGTGQVTVVAGTGSSIQSVYSYTQTYGQGATLYIYVDTNLAGQAAHAWIRGDGGPMGGGGGSISVTDGTTTYTSTTSLQVASASLSGSASAAVFSPFAPFYNKSANYTLNASENDEGAQINITGSGLTLTFPVTIFPAKQTIQIFNTNATNALTIANSGSYSLLGLATLSIPPQAGLGCLSDGTNYNCVALGYPSVNPYLAATEVFTGKKTFATVNGSSDTTGLGSSTYTIQAADCGKTLPGSYAGTAVWTIPASIVPAAGTTCIIAILTTTANKIAVNGTAVTAATLVSADSYTGTAALAGAQIELTLTTVSSTATAYLAGRGS